MNDKTCPIKSGDERELLRAISIGTPVNDEVLIAQLVCNCNGWDSVSTAIWFGDSPSLEEIIDAICSDHDED